jgi:hypothetical protein
MYSLDYKMFISGLSIIFGIICYIPYIKDIYKWNTKPHTISRLIRALTTWLWFFAQLQDGVWRWSFTLWLFCIINFWIFLYALKKWETKITKLDYSALIVSIIALFLRIFIKVPIWSIILICIADSLWFYPTFYKSYFDPESESKSFRTLTVTSLILSLFAMNHLSLVWTLYTFTMIFREINLIWLLILRRKYNISS